MFKKIFILLTFLCFSLAFANKTVFLPNEKGILAEQKDEGTIETLDENALQTPEYKHTFMKMMLSLVALIVLSIVTVWMFRRISKARVEAINNLRSIKILEKRVLSPKSMLYLVEYENQKFIISESHLDVRITKID